jgi:hypothetical protein
MKLQVSIAVVVLTWGAVSLTCAQDKVSFAGKWKGEWKNSAGETGRDTLALREDSDGSLSGKWTGDVALTGRRVNRNTLELRGATRTRSYQLTATVQGGVMTLKYLVTRLDAEGAYDGESILQREDAAGR